MSFLTILKNKPASRVQHDLGRCTELRRSSTYLLLTNCPFQYTNEIVISRSRDERLSFIKEPANKGLQGVVVEKEIVGRFGIDFPLTPVVVGDDHPTVPKGYFHDILPAVLRVLVTIANGSDHLSPACCTQYFS